MRTKKIGDQSPLRVPAVSAKKIATLPLLIISLKSKGRLMIAKMGKRKQDNGNYQLLYKQIDDAIFAKIYLSSEGTIVVKEGRIGQRLIHRKYGAPDWPKIQAEIEISKAKGYVSLSEHEMDVLDLSLPTVSLSLEEVEFIRVEFSEFLVDSALGFFRGQHENDETVTFTFFVVKYDTARDALLNALRGFSVAPVGRIRRSAMELAGILNTFRWWVSINALIEREVAGVKRFAKRFILCGLALNLGSRCV